MQLNRINGREAVLIYALKCLHESNKSERDMAFADFFTRRTTMGTDNVSIEDDLHLDTLHIVCICPKTSHPSIHQYHGYLSSPRRQVQFRNLSEKTYRFL